MKNRLPRPMYIVATVGIAIALAATSTARGALLHAVSYNYSGTNGATLWQFDTGAGTLAKQASFDFSYVQSMADTGDYLYVTAWSGSNYDISQIDKTTYAVVSAVSVGSLGIPGYSNSPRLSGMTYDGSDLWGMDFDGVTHKLQMDGTGKPSGASAGIDALPAGSVQNGLTGTLAFDATGNRYLAANNAQQWPYSTTDLTSGTPVQGNRYNNYDYIGGSAFDADGNWWIAEVNKALISHATLLGNNAVGTQYDFATELAAEGHIGFGAMATQVSNVVPEPGSLIVWALLIAGAISGAVVRRRR